MDFERVYRWDGPPSIELQRAAQGSHGWQHRVLVQDGRPGVVIAPVHASRIGLVKLWRPALAEHRWELPRGFGETVPDEDARRELLEETGLVAESIRLLGKFNVDTGLAPTLVYAYRADVAHPEPSRTTDGETDELRWVDLAAIRMLIEQGQIQDAISLAALALLRIRG